VRAVGCDHKAWQMRHRVDPNIVTLGPRKVAARSCLSSHVPHNLMFRKNIRGRPFTKTNIIG
jgi:hypothetical protein